MALINRLCKAFLLQLRNEIIFQKKITKEHLEMKLMNYLQAKLVKAEIKFFKLNGSLKLQFHTKRRIIGLGNLHKKFINELVKNDNGYLEASKQFLKANFNGYRDARWHKCIAALNGIKEANYIPEDIYYTIFHRAFNNEKLTNAYKDKNMLERFYPDVNTPTTVLRVIKGKYHAEDYSFLNYDKVESLFLDDKKYVFKPAIDSGCGQGVVVGDKSKILTSLNRAMDRKDTKNNKNYIVQKYLMQHDAIKSLHPESVNTMRVMTLRLGKKIHHVSSVLRMGINENTIDNFTSGGIAAGLDKDGKLKKYAFDAKYNRYETHKTSKIKFEGYQIPKFDEAVELCKKLHTKLFYFDVVSWDIAISSESEVYLIEYNITGPNIMMHQLNNGPIFGDLTDEVIASLSK